MANSVTQWLDRAADSVAFVEFVEERTREYNASLLDGERPISEQEMGKLLEEKMGKGEKETGRKLNCTWCVHYGGEPEGTRSLGRVNEQAWCRVTFDGAGVGDVVPVRVPIYFAEFCEYFDARKREEPTAERELLTMDDDEPQGTIGLMCPLRSGSGGAVQCEADCAFLLRPENECAVMALGRALKNGEFGVLNL